MGVIDNYSNTLTSKPSESVEKAALDLQDISRLVQTSFPKAAFNEDVYRSLLPLTLLATQAEEGSENPDAAKANAAKLTILFGTTEKALNYLKSYEKKNPERTQMLHDACLFSLPAGEHWNIKLWQALANTHMPEKILERILPFAEKIETYVKTNSKASVVRDHELSLSQEYDQEHEVNPNVLADKINKNFQATMKQQLNIPLTGKISEEQIRQLRTRMANLTKEDLEKKHSIEEEERRSAEETLKKKRKNISQNQNKQAYIAEQLEKRSALIESNVKSQFKNLLSPNTTLDALLGYMNKLGYTRAKENPEAAALFFEHGLGEAQFEHYLKLKPVDDANHIPEVGLVRLDAYPGFYLQKLSPHDPRAAILGKLTSCCQSLGHASGETSTIHGITDPRGGFYILCKQLSQNGPDRRDPIVAQCWAWRSQQNNLVFDSVESQVNARKNSPKIIYKYFDKLADLLVRQHGVKRVLVGLSLSTLESFQQEHQCPMVSEQPVGYYGHSDAIKGKQRIMADEFFKLYSDVKSQTITNLESHRALVKEWCAICAINNGSETFLLPILTRLAPPGFNAAQTIELNRKYRQLLDRMDSADEWGEDLWAEQERLITQGAHVTIPSAREEALLLTIASREGRLGTVKLLIDSGASLDASASYHPLETAVEKGHTEIIEYLLSKMVSKKIMDTTHTKKGNTLLHLAKNAVVTQLILNQIDDINAANIHGETPLHKAVGTPPEVASSKNQVHGDLPRVTLLVKHHAEVNTRNKKGQTPLYYSVINQDLNVAEYLLHNKANPDIPDKENQQTPLHMAAIQGNLPLVTLLVKQGASVNAKNIYSQTPLALVDPTTETRVEIIKYLLEHGAELNMKGNHYKTPLLHKAVDSKNMPLVHYLIEEAGADVDARDIHNETPLIKAISHSQFLIAHYLLELGANVDAADNSGCTALSNAAELGDSEENLAFIKYLIEVRGAEINPKKTHPNDRACGTPALCTAAKGGHLKVVAYLFEHGAEVNFAGENQNTALHLAAKNGHLAVVHYLIEEAKAKTNLTNAEKKSAAQVAADGAADSGADERAKAVAAYFNQLKTKQTQQDVGALLKIGAFSHADHKAPGESINPVPAFTKLTRPATI